jgi:hypothetical protein
MKKGGQVLAYEERFALKGGMPSCETSWKVL